jgi:hypothetical protein
LSVFEEIGASKPEEVSLEKVKPDRRELDRIVMGEILGLNEAEQLAVYRAVVDLVSSRLARARSVPKKNKIREGIDLAALVQTVVEKIGGKKLGRFYQSLDLRAAKKIVLPKLAETVKIEPTLMGWRVLTGKQNLDCQNEAEAKFLKIFLETGWEEVAIPPELEKILPRLEKIVVEIKETLDYYTEGVLDTRLKKQVENLVWRAVSEI